MSVVERIIQAAQRQRRALRIALAGVVQHDIQQHADTGILQRLHGLAYLGEPARRQSRIGRHESHGVIAPAIGEPQRRQMTLVDPGGDRHQFDSVDADPPEMLDHQGMGQRRNRPAQRLRQIRMALTEGLDRNLVNEPRLPWRRPRRLRHRRGHDRLRHQRRGIPRRIPRRRQIRMPGEGPVERRRVGIDQQLGRIEAMAPGRIERAIGAQPIAHARSEAGYEAVMHIAGSPRQRQAGDLPVIAFIEDADPDLAPRGATAPPG